MRTAGDSIRVLHLKDPKDDKKLRKDILWGDNTFDAVREAIAKLVKKGHPGPYLLLLDPDAYSDLFTQDEDRQSMTADRIRPLVTEGLVQTTGLPRLKATTSDPEIQTGLLVSKGGDPVIVYYAQAPITEPTSQAGTGEYNFRVVERYTYVLREPDALVRLEFENPP